MSGTPLKNLRLFERLCGRDFRNVILVTTMWDEVDPETGDAREAELCRNYWEFMISRGSQVCRFERTQRSALKIISPFFTNINDKHALLLQQEVTDLGRSLPNTTAGALLSKDLQSFAKKQQVILSRIRQDLQDPRLDEYQLWGLTQAYQERSADLEQAIKDIQKMKIPIRERLATRIGSFNVQRLHR
jgi:hypothetical protein